MKTDNDALPPDYLSRVHPRPAEDLTVSIPTDVRVSLETVAARRDMTVAALVRSYIGQALREDLAQVYAEQNTAAPAELLAP